VALVVTALLPVLIKAVAALVQFLAHVFAGIGMSVIIPVDFLGSAFTWVGVENPALGWLFVGCFAGAIIGLAEGFRRTGRQADQWKVYLGGVLLGCTLLAAAYAAAPTSEKVAGNDNTGPHPTPTRPITPPTKSPAPPPNMVYVPGGEFTMGDDNGDELQRPAHKETVPPFFIDKYEVSCADYEQFVKTTKPTGSTLPPNWVRGHCPAGREHWPVTGVDWPSAAAYAAALHKRLPTEAEWEFAARGAQGFKYPWGNEWQPGAANADTSSRRHMANVTEFAAGASPFGALNMVGNAWEWTADDLRSYTGGPLPATLATGEAVVTGKVIRGGYWDSLQGEDATTTFRRGYPAQGKDYSNTSFRCVQDLAPAPSPHP
jgi:formylglycine-generating enzyme required for sulfatase activity